jgi:hypothetical protein
MKPELLESDLNSFLQGHKMILHIIHRGGKKWALKKPNAKKAMRIFKTVKEAEDFARSLTGIRQVIIHRKDASVARTITIIFEAGQRSTEIEFFA